MNLIPDWMNEVKPAKEKPATAELIKAVREHAEEHYSAGRGWDYVVECWSDEDIAKQIKGANTARGAIRKVAQVVSIIAEREREATSEIF